MIQSKPTRMRPDVPLVKVEKNRPTGTKELSTIAKALDNIHDGMNNFMETIMRSPEKESEIAARLSELKDAIEDQGVISEIEEILRSLDERIFREKYYTEKCNKGVIRMTDDTKLVHLRAFASEAAKVAGAKYKVSAGDYLPKATVLEKLQQSLMVFQKTLQEHLGPAAGVAVVKETIMDLEKIWDE